jgi:hypothetical protein
MCTNDGDKLLARFIDAKDFLEPTKSADYFGHTPDTLEETRPIFRGTWILTDPNTHRPVGPFSGPQCFIVLQVDWTDDEHGKYEKGTPNYYRLEPGKHGRKQNIDLKLLEMIE